MPPIPVQPDASFPAWHSVYEAMLRETDSVALFKLVEVAEAAIRTRREILEKTDGSPAEQKAIEHALQVLSAIKQVQLRFSGTAGSPQEHSATRLQ